MLKQTVKPDRVLLWLSDEQFPNRNLPAWADIYNRAGVEFRFVPEDLKPHKKYFYTLQEYPGAIVILVDDDLFYENDMVEKLYNAYLRFPYAISTLTANKITFDRHGHISRFYKWALWDCDKHINKPSMLLYPISGHGTLLPPNALNPEVFNKEAIKRLCLYDDELWLKIMSVLQGTPVVLADYNAFRPIIAGSQVEGSLIKRGGFEGQLTAERIRTDAFAAYNEFLGKEDTVEKRMQTMYATENTPLIPDFYIKRGIHKKVVYTAKTDGLNPLKAPSFVTPGWDYICFSDKTEDVPDFWKIIPLNESAAKIKALPHKYLADYDYSLWIDPDYDIIDDIDEVAVNNNSGYAMLCFSTGKSVYDECVNLAGDSDIITQRLQKYADDGYGKQYCMADTSVLFRKHNEPGLIGVSEAWWMETVNYCKADALSLDYICWKRCFSYDAHFPIAPYIYKQLYFKQILDCR
jgi:hypothetical protein